jgi:uncharacterized membrane protein YeaQ/YmgE (transglycosylase-associated protein family)
MMGPIAWALVGLFVSFVTMMTVKEHGEEYFGDIIFGIGGASLGGLIGLWLGWWSMMGVGLHCIVFTFIGAIAGIVIYHALILHHGHGGHGPPLA